MKNKILVALSLVFLVACNNLKENEFLVSGSIKDFKDGTKVYLEKQGDATNPFEKLDTAVIKDGKFEFKSEFKEPGFYFIGFDQDVMGKISFIAEHGEITIESKKDSLNTSKVTGTHSNDALAKFIKDQDGIMKEKKKYFEANNQKYQDALKINDTVTMNTLGKGIKVYDDKIDVLATKHINEDSKSFLALIFIEQKINRPDADMKQIKSWYDKLDEQLKNTKSGKNIKSVIDQTIKK
ncbi:MAG: DUF4369 domain-containing protein [Flavobacterium sp.]|jgi:hypothetical protein